MIPERQLESVNEAFSRQSANYDSYDNVNLILQWMRKRVRDHASTLIKPGSDILELNAGTGLDAAYFASKGHNVFATDIAEGMIKELKNKAMTPESQNRIRIQQLSYTDLNQLPEKQFDYIFSNFGGMNCVPDLKPVLDQFKRLLKPGGIVSLVIMPKVCPWEILSILKGNSTLAFRRFRKNGAVSNVEGVNFTTYYFNPKEVIRELGVDYRLLKIEGLCCLVPPPSHRDFPEKRPKLFKLLIKMEQNVARLPIFNSFADHYILSMQFMHAENM